MIFWHCACSTSTPSSSGVLIYFGQVLRADCSDWDDAIPGAGIVYGMICMGLEEVASTTAPNGLESAVPNSNQTISGAFTQSPMSSKHRDDWMTASSGCSGPTAIGMAGMPRAITCGGMRRCSCLMPQTTTERLHTTMIASPRESAPWLSGNVQLRVVAVSARRCRTELR